MYAAFQLQKRPNNQACKACGINVMSSQSLKTAGWPHDSVQKSTGSTYSQICSYLHCRLIDVLKALWYLIWNMEHAAVLPLGMTKEQW